jgi:type I restriction enzyme M protein
MPESLFKTSGKGGTHTKVCVMVIRKTIDPQSKAIFMGDAKWCGHDSRGNPTLRKNNDGETVLLDDVPVIKERYHSLLAGGRKQDHLGFWLKRSEVQNNIFVPKYYNPEIAGRLDLLEATHNVKSVRELVDEGILTVETGVEVGKMAYGTGKIPFIRISDISNWEIKADFKHGVSDAIYDEWSSKLDVIAGDILMVKDGTYLVGTTAIVTESDLPMLFQSHLYRIRSLDHSVVDPFVLLAVLNTSIVKAQIRAKQFTQDIIDTLGRRLLELKLPLPKEKKLREKVANETRKLIETRIALRNRAQEIPREIEDGTFEFLDD